MCLCNVQITKCNTQHSIWLSKKIKQLLKELISQRWETVCRRMKEDTVTSLAQCFQKCQLGQNVWARIFRESGLDKRHWKDKYNLCQLCRWTFVSMDNWFNPIITVVHKTTGRCYVTSAAGCVAWKHQVKQKHFLN